MGETERLLRTFLEVMEEDRPYLDRLTIGSALEHLLRRAVEKMYGTDGQEPTGSA